MVTIPVSQADLDRDRLIELKRSMKAQVKANGIGSFGWARASLSKIDELIGRENRMMFLSDVFGHPVKTSRDLTPAELFSVCMWAKPQNTNAGVIYDPDFIHDISILQVVYNHQLSLPLSDQKLEQ
jgi:hypothetical protein